MPETSRSVGSTPGGSERPALTGSTTRRYANRFGTRSRSGVGSTAVRGSMRRCVRTGSVVLAGRVARLMREDGLAAPPRRRKPRTTDSQHGNPVAPNLLARQFTAAGPNHIWVADITAVATQANGRSLAAVLDRSSRRVVGWALGAHRDEQLVLQALRMALQQRQPPLGLLHHSEPLGSRQSVHQRRLPRSVGPAGDHREYEP